MSEKKTADLEEFQQSFRRRYIFKKTINMLMSSFIVFCGITAILYSVFVNHMNLFDRLRYMTFDGTIFTTIISFIFTIVCLIEAVYETEATSRFVFFMRLSSATTEFIIFCVVMVGLTNLVPDHPDITTYTGIMTHLVIPITTLICFIFNDAPLGKFKPLEPFFGTWFITIYAVIMTTLLLSGIIPYELAPYSFLDFKHTPFLFSLACLIGIYVVGYHVSLLLILINQKMTWIWFTHPVRYIRSLFTAKKKTE